MKKEELYCFTWITNTDNYNAILFSGPALKSLLRPLITEDHMMSR